MDYVDKYFRPLCLIAFTLIMAGFSSAEGNNTGSYSTTPWSIRMAESEMARHPGGYRVGFKTWDYVIGTVMKGFEQLWDATGDTSYFQYIKTTVDAGVSSTGKISSSGYSFLSYTLDGINEGKAVLLLHKRIGTAKYKIAADTLRKQLSSHPRVSEGGFWHKKVYTNQMWLDGLYMGSPFYSEYGLLFSDTAAHTDVVNQFTMMENHARDSITSLLYHGWDESKTAQWADATTGCSPSFWGRAIGWYAMALVDALDYIPSDHIGRTRLIAILQRLAVGVKNFQDSTYGTWYQVIDQGYRPDNWREASASCMFVYALAKAVRKGYIDESYWNVVKKGYAGVLDEFISVNGDSTINLNNICLSAGLDAAPGAPRDGSYDYYVNRTGAPVSNDGKGTGPFIMASVELERTGFVVPPLRFQSTFLQDSVLLMWTDMTYNAASFIVERRSEAETNFTQIGEVVKGTTAFIDRLIQNNTTYYYRARAKSDTGYSDYSGIDSVIVPPLTSICGDLRSVASAFNLLQIYPNPFNPTAQVEFLLKQKDFTTVKIYDILGKEIASLFDGYAESGRLYQLEFHGLHISTGTYFVILRSGTVRLVRKVLVVK